MWRPLRSPNRGWRLLGVGRNGKINTSLGLSLPPTSGHCSPCPLLPNWTRAPISAGHSPASKSKSSCEVGQLQRSTRTHSMAGQRSGPVAGNFFFFLAVLGFCCCPQAFCSCGECGLLSSRGVQASHCGGFSLQSTGSRVRELR